MTAVELPIYIPEPLEHQLEVDLSPKRFKLLHHGRRWGKDRVALKGAVAGHGPTVDGQPMFPGVAHGWWIGWVVRDFTQGSGIWLEEFLPRFEAAKPQVSVNKNELRITLPNGGGIFLCTGQNIASLRGLGKRMKGLVINEAAHLDLESAWTGVLRALLVDNRGWAILMSTPNAGDDGNTLGTVPSYFNRLCSAVQSASLGDEWGVFGGDLRENPVIDPKEALSFLRDLGEGSARQREEGYGQLLTGGKGLAFPNWDPDIHLSPWRDAPEDWAMVMGMDWGINNDAAVVAALVGPHKELELIREWTWSDLDAYEAGYEFATGLLTAGLPRWPEWLVCDSAMNERTGVGGTTIWSEFQAGVNDALKVTRAPKLNIVPAPKGPGSRVAGYNQVRKVLAWGPRLATGVLPASRMPQMRIRRDQQGGPTCPRLVKDLATLTLHKTKTDDVDERNKELSHHYSALRYLLAMVLPASDPVTVEVPQDRHPGMLVTGVRRERVRTPEVVAREKRIELEWLANQRGHRIGGRYGRNPRH